MRYCNNCKKIFADGTFFCAKCGTKLTEENNFCLTCGAEISKEQDFCVQCGNSLKSEKTEKQVCPGCGIESEGDELFCQRCGTPVNFKLSSPSSPKNFVSAVKEDLNQRKTVKLIKEKTWTNPFIFMDTSKKIIIAIVAFAVAAACIGFNTHKCENCDKLYIGKQYSFMGGKLCKDCYRDYTVIEW